MRLMSFLPSSLAMAALLTAWTATHPVMAAENDGTEAPAAAAPAAPQAAPADGTAAGAPAGKGAGHRHRTLAQRFADANTTHDGKLTPQQAQQGMPFVARSFAKIDKTGKGYVTLDDIHAYQKERRAAWKARKAAAAAAKPDAQSAAPAAEPAPAH